MVGRDALQHFEHMIVVKNWFEELKANVGHRKRQALALMITFDCTGGFAGPRRIMDWYRRLGS